MGISQAEIRIIAKDLASSTLAAVGTSTTDVEKRLKALNLETEQGSQKTREYTNAQKDSSSASQGVVVSLAALGLAYQGVKSIVGDVVGAIGNAAISFARHSDEMGDLAGMAGTTVEEFSALSAATVSLGEDAGVLQQGLTMMSLRLKEAQKNGGETSGALKDLGITSIGTGDKLKSSTEVLTMIADKIAELPPGIKRTQIEMEIFGRAGAKLDPILSLTGKGLRNVADEMTKLGLATSAAEAQMGGDMIASMNQIEQYGQAFIKVFQRAITPVVAETFALIADKGRVAINYFIDSMGGMDQAVATTKDVLLDLKNVLADSDGPKIFAAGARLVVETIGAINNAALTGRESVYQILEAISAMGARWSVTQAGRDLAKQLSLEYGELAKKAHDAAARNANLTTSISDSIAKFETAGRETKKLAGNTGEASKEVEILHGNMGKAGSSAQQMGEKTKDAGEKVKGASESIRTGAHDIDLSMEKVSGSVEKARVTMTKWSEDGTKSARDVVDKYSDLTNEFADLGKNVDKLSASAQALHDVGILSDEEIANLKQGARATGEVTEKVKEFSSAIGASSDAQKERAEKSAESWDNEHNDVKKAMEDTYGQAQADKKIEDGKKRLKDANDRLWDSYRTGCDGASRSTYGLIGVIGEVTNSVVNLSSQARAALNAIGEASFNAAASVNDFATKAQTTNPQTMQGEWKPGPYLGGSFGVNVYDPNTGGVKMVPGVNSGYEGGYDSTPPPPQPAPKPYVAPTPGLDALAKYEADQRAAQQKLLDQNAQKIIALQQQGMSRQQAEEIALHGMPHYATGGIAWHRQIAMVAENEPELIIPLSLLNHKQPAPTAVKPSGGGGGSFSVSSQETAADAAKSKAFHDAYSAAKSAGTMGEWTADTYSNATVTGGYGGGGSAASAGGLEGLYSYENQQKAQKDAALKANAGRITELMKQGLTRSQAEEVIFGSKQSGYQSGYNYTTGLFANTEAGMKQYVESYNDPMSSSYHKSAAKAFGGMYGEGTGHGYTGPGGSQALQDALKKAQDAISKQMGAGGAGGGGYLQSGARLYEPGGSSFRGDVPNSLEEFNAYASGGSGTRGRQVSMQPVGSTGGGYSGGYSSGGGSYGGGGGVDTRAIVDAILQGMGRIQFLLDGKPLITRIQTALDNGELRVTTRVTGQNGII